MSPPATSVAASPSPAGRRITLRAAALGPLAAALAFIAGCSSAGMLIGGMAESAHRSGSTTKDAEYAGLQGKDFAVIIAADRAVQADFPDLVPLMTREVTKRLQENAGASGVLPADEVLKFQYKRPGWVAMPLDALAKELEAQRLVYIDLRDFALTDPGNPYVWNGVASGVVSVVEADGPTPTDFKFSKPVRVHYPDSTGFGPDQVLRDGVYLELARRFINRSAWMFYTHDEKNVIKY